MFGDYHLSIVDIIRRRVEFTCQRTCEHSIAPYRNPFNVMISETMKKVRWNRHYGYYQVFSNVLGLLNIHPNHDITHTTNGMPGPFAKMSWYQAEADPHSLHEWWFMEREGETTGDQKETPSVIEIAYINAG